jgi:hypothetical protein
MAGCLAVVMSDIKAEVAATGRRLAQELEDEVRFGEAYDEPEGSRGILVSDTLAKQIATLLRTLSALVTE